MQPNYQLPGKLTGLPSVPLWTALLSFVFGTLIFLTHQVSQPDFQETMLYVGLMYVIASVAINVLVFFAMIILSFFYKKRQREILINTAIQLLNIPVVVLYFVLIFS